MTSPMDSITPGAGHDPQALARRVERIELALNPYQELDVVAEIVGRGMTRGRMLMQPMGPGDDASIAGAFFSLITDSLGDIYLQTGTVNGGDVPALSLKVYDLSSTSWQGTTGQHLFLEVAGTGEVADGVLLAGFNITGVTVTIGTPLEHVPPTAAVATGTAYVSLGVFYGESFAPAAAGNVGITFCPSGFTITREN